MGVMVVVVVVVVVGVERRLSATCRPRGVKNVQGVLGAHRDTDLHGRPFLGPRRPVAPPLGERGRVLGPVEQDHAVRLVATAGQRFLENIDVGHHP